MTHFSRFNSPMRSVLSGYTYIAGLSVFFYYHSFYSESTLFTWGIPVVFMGKTIEDESTYYLIIALLFIHQLINNWVNSVAYAWIINNVQDEKSEDILYPDVTAMILINLFSLYSELDMILLISGSMSQIPFFLAMMLANVIASSIINWQYISAKKIKRAKKVLDLLSEDELNLV